MADDSCISVYFSTTDSYWDYCWEDLTPDPSWQSENVTTGLRKSQTTKARAWRTCQYYLKGAPAICEHWTEGAIGDSVDTLTSGSYYCSYVKDNTSDNPNDPLPEDPTGYNYAQCDFLGRRVWCDRYEKSVEYDPEEWICVAPNPYLTGLGEKSQDSEKAIFRPVSRKDIWGYNDANDGTGKGLCDCHGFGRGAGGCKKTVTYEGDPSEEQSEIEEEISKKPIICNYYRPYQMGFGVIKPAEKFPGDVLPDGTITEQGWQRALDWERRVHTRLPLNYEMYNYRARFQKCQWWEEEAAREYLEDNGFLYLDGDPEIFDDSGKVEFCKNPDSNTIPYNTRAFEDWDNEVVPYPFTSQMALEGVYAKGGGPVCNGCRPDCPGYSGRWLHMTNDKALPGMAVTANQVLELRFWAANWDSQEQYDSFFERKPNFDDPDTSFIYTFTKWEHADANDIDKSTMLGLKLGLCQPAPYNNKEFSLEYVTKEDVVYPNVETGTTEETQVHFPSLIRQPEFGGIKPFAVFYPYYNDEVFDSAPCFESGFAGHLKRNNTIYGDYVKSIGYTISNKKVYIINTSIVECHALLKDYSGIYAVKDINIKLNLYNYIIDLIDKAKTYYPDYITQTTSDNTFGYFQSQAVRLKYNTGNKLLICVDYEDGTWEYRWRIVNSLWCGGIVKQNSFTHSYKSPGAIGYKNNQPGSFSPDAEASLSLVTLGGSLTADLISTFSFNDEEEGKTYYSWSIIWQEEEDIPQERWGAIGNTNRILVEIDEININYIFEWQVISAKLVAKTETDEEGNEIKVGGKNIPNEIELEVVIEDDDALPPNLCVLKPKEDIRYRFFNSIWELYVTYKYKNFVDGESVTDFDDVTAGADPDTYLTSPYDVNDLGNITDITSGPIQVLGNFYDSDSRLIACNATRVLTNIVSERCRPVEIRYRYFAEAPLTVLEPRSGFCINTASKKATGDMKKISESPDCGDHEESIWFRWQGPMWFPFNVCRGFYLYDEWTICNHCQAGYIGPINDGVYRDDTGNLVLIANTALKRNDFRYCGPHQQKAYGKVRSAIPSPCNCGCIFYYADARDSSVVFSGYANLKTTVDEKLYEYYGWIMPPFGNDGRELIEKYLSNDYKAHQNTETGTWKSSWMPMMMDNTMFFFPDFNCFSADTSQDEYYYVSAFYSEEPFGYTNQLNFGYLSDIKEQVSENRVRWGDIFEIHHEANCTYPLPKYPISGQKTKAIFYRVKNDNYAWAWPEYWSDIVRQDVETRLGFLDLERPKYHWSAQKEEHRFICEEGSYTIIYTGPELDEETGKLSKYPTISLGGGHPRAFELLYDEYNSDQVTWKDDGGAASVSGSSDEDNLYEEAMAGDWIHSENIIFDKEATSNTAIANKIATSLDGFTSDPLYSYYNTGLIANITKDRLDYLPKILTDKDYEPTDDNTGIYETTGDGAHTKFDEKIDDFGEVKFVWSDPESTVTITPSEKLIKLTRIYIEGVWGYKQKPSTNPVQYYKITHPSVNITATFKDNSIDNPRGFNDIIAEVLPDNEIEDGKLKNYTIDIRLPLGPKEVIGNKQIKKLNIIFGTYPGYYTAIKSITIRQGSYVENKEEEIYVWERKYIPSTISGTYDNLESASGDFTQYALNMDNSGQYFPFRGSRFENDEFYSITTNSKLRSVACGPRYTEDISLNVTYDNLHDLEINEQEYWYKQSFIKDELGDVLTFNGILPPNVAEAFEENDINYGAVGNLYVTSEALSWEKTQQYKQFKQYDYWRPGGHTYEWSKYWQKANCYIFGGPETIFQGDFRHHSHPYPAGLVEEAESILNSYYNLRFDTVIAKYKRAQILGGDYQGDTITSANPFKIGGP